MIMCDGGIGMTIISLAVRVHDELAQSLSTPMFVQSSYAKPLLTLSLLDPIEAILVSSVSSW